MRTYTVIVPFVVKVSYLQPPADERTTVGYLQESVDVQKGHNLKIFCLLGTLVNCLYSRVGTQEEQVH